MTAQVAVGPRAPGRRRRRRAGRGGHGLASPLAHVAPDGHQRAARDGRRVLRDDERLVPAAAPKSSVSDDPSPRNILVVAAAQSGAGPIRAPGTRLPLARPRPPRTFRLGSRGVAATCRLGIFRLGRPVSTEYPRRRRGVAATPSPADSHVPGTPRAASRGSTEAYGSRCCPRPSRASGTRPRTRARSRFWNGKNVCPSPPRRFSRAAARRSGGSSSSPWTRSRRRSKSRAATRRRRSRGDRAGNRYGAPSRRAFGDAACPRRDRGGAATRLHGVSASRPRRLVSAEYPRRGRGDSSPRNIRVAATASRRLHGLATRPVGSRAGHAGGFRRLGLGRVRRRRRRARGHRSRSHRTAGPRPDWRAVDAFGNRRRGRRDEDPATPLLRVQLPRAPLLRRALDPRRRVPAAAPKSSPPRNRMRPSTDVAAAAPPRPASAVYDLHGLSTPRPRRRRDPPPPYTASTDHPRLGRGAAATFIGGRPPR